MQEAKTPSFERRLDREAAVGRFAAGLQHEVSNLLSVIDAWTRVLATEGQRLGLKAPANQAPGRIQEALDRLVRLTRASQMSTNGVLRPMRLRFQIAEIAANAMELVAPRLRSAGVELVMAPDAPVLAMEKNAGALTAALALGILHIAPGHRSLMIRVGSEAGDEKQPAGFIQVSGDGQDAEPRAPDASGEHDLALAQLLATEQGATLTAGAPGSLLTLRLA